MSVSIDLLPCPFCGGQAAFSTIKYPEKSDTAKLNGQDTFYGISCVICGGSSLGLIGSWTKETAAERWNKRFPEGR